MENIKCVLLDIEGTICPISFVKDTLFPYALKALPEFLASKWHDGEFKTYLDAFPESDSGTPEALQAHVEDLTRRDVKVAYIKNLQGYLWENGYETGAYSTPLFPDVASRLKLWKEAGHGLAIYSSGSVFAQKLLFGHVRATGSVAGQKRSRQADSTEVEDDVAMPPTKKHAAPSGDGFEKAVGVEAADAASIHTGADDDTSSENVASAKDKVNGRDTVSADRGALGTEDLRYLIMNWFDTTNAGPKTDERSYMKIADELQISPAEVLFLSDNVKEVDAALEAGMQAMLVDRPGNAPLSGDDRTRLNVITSLDEIKLAEHDNSTEDDSQGSADVRSNNGPGSDNAT